MSAPKERNEKAEKPDGTSPKSSYGQKLDIHILHSSNWDTMTGDRYIHVSSTLTSAVTELRALDFTLDAPVVTIMSMTCPP